MKNSETLEMTAWNCDAWPEWLRVLIQNINDVADRTDMSSEQAHAYGILLDLSLVADRPEFFS